jgi:pimeloyl-ACP methyl ester carboxylesterase
MKQDILSPCGKSAIAFFTALVVSLILPPVLAADSGIAAPADANGAIIGTWSGSLDVGGSKLPLVFHIVESSGSLAASMDSPAQGAKGIPASSASFKAGLLSIDIAAIRGGFEGRLAADGKSIAGAWKQGGRSFQLTLTRSDNASGPARPQTPAAPFPYSVEELKVPGGAAGVVLAGSLVIPAGKGPFPAVVLVTGSGPQDRDETILGHKPFLVIADYLARRGIASFRYDDRGVASSTGDFSSATSLDFAADAEAALDCLAARKELDPGRIGIVGHSEGGLIAPIVASRDPAVGFIVLLSGPGLRGDALLLLQSEAIARASGAGEADLAEIKAANASLYSAALGTPGGMEEKRDAVKKAYSDYIGSREGLPAADRSAALAKADETARALVNPWMLCFLGLDPAPYIAEVKVPVLALGGTKDLQVPVDEDFAAIRAAARPDARLALVRLEGLNHLFQHAGSGLPSEYGTIEETFAPEALAAIGDWISALK